MKRTGSALGYLGVLALLAACAREAPGPTLAPTPTLQPQAWLISYGTGGIRVYDTESRTQTDLDLPELWFPQIDLPDGLGAPNSGLLAVRTVSEECVPIDLSLTIVDLNEASTVRVIPLLSEELSDRLREQRGQLIWTDEDVYLALLDRWFRPHWSADGRSVVFAAALDGPSTDVYFYDVERDELRRLTEEREQAVVLGWSPDGEWVVYAEAFDFELDDFSVPDRERIGYLTQVVRAVSLRTGQVVELYEDPSQRRVALVGWSASDDFALVEVEPDLGMLYI